jgi:hypothetical protein
MLSVCAAMVKPHGLLLVSLPKACVANSRYLTPIVFRNIARQLSLKVIICVCMCMYVRACIWFVCMYVYIYICIYMCVCMYVCNPYVLLSVRMTCMYHL